MATLYTIPQYITFGEVTTFLMANYEEQSALFGDRLLKKSSPDLVAIVTDALKWHYEMFPAVAEVDAVGSITVNSIGNNNDTVMLAIVDPDYAIIDFGVYVKSSSETTIPQVCTAMAAAWNANNTLGYTITPTSTQVIIQARGNTGARMNDGNRIIVTVFSSRVFDSSFDNTYN